jgi:hypothetical protein
MLVHQRVFESVLISIKEGHDDKYKAVEIWHGALCVFIFLPYLSTFKLESQPLSGVLHKPRKCLVIPDFWA